MAENITRLQFLKKKWSIRLKAAADMDLSFIKKEDAIDHLAEMDPSPRKEYLDWICRMYVARQFFIEDKERVLATLTLFHRWKHRLPSVDRDIGRHKSEQSVWDVIQRFDPTNATEDDNVEGRELRRREKAQALSQSFILEGDLDGWIVATPLTHNASVWWGRGTRWCTAMANYKGHFNTYSSQGPLRIMISPEGKKFQAHLATTTCCDSSDARVDFEKFLNTVPPVVLDLLRQDTRAVFGFSASTAKKNIQLWQLKHLPRILLDDETMAIIVQAGLDRIRTVVADNGTMVTLVADELAKWALGINIEKNNPSFYRIVADGTTTHELRLENKTETKTIVDFVKAIRVLPEEDHRKVFKEMIDHWEKQMTTSAYPVALIEGYGQENLTEEHWKALASIQRKKARDWHEFKIPAGYVTEEIAKVLAVGPSLLDIPTEIVTQDVIKIFLKNNAPLFLTSVMFNFSHLIDEDVLVAMAGWKNGEGLKFVPAEYLEPSFFIKVVDTYPKAVQFIPKELITPELATRCLEIDSNCFQLLPKGILNDSHYKVAVSANGHNLQHIPFEKRTDELSEMAAKIHPDCLPFVTCELSYGQYLTAVSRSGSLLSRVPLVYRTEEMCLAALTDGLEISSHVPPLLLQKLIQENPTVYYNKLSARYPANDPIRTFMPDPDAELPSKLHPLLMGCKKATKNAPHPIVTGEPIVLEEVAVATI